jgi:hypothetical protein
MLSIKRGLVVCGMFVLSACGAPSTDPKTAEEGKPSSFTYAPTLDRPYRETNRRYEEMTIPGSPMRESEEWTLEWQAVVTRETNLFKRSLRLTGLKISINGAPQLRGDEVKPAMATVDVLTDKDSNVVDVRGADQLSAAIVALGDERARPALERIFSPARLKALAMVRSQELHQDLIGRPTPVGSQWMAQGSSGATTRQVSVVREEACGASRCLRVMRKYDVDGQVLFGEVSARVAAYVQSQGGDPTKVALAGMDVKLEDSLLVDPTTMEYYDARFSQEANLKVAGPNGELPVSFKVRREVDYQY